MNKTYIIIVVLILAAIAVGAYWYFYERSTPVSGLPNPASVYCIEDLGGTLEFINTPEGQVGICHLPDGRECEEWELYRTGRCVPWRENAVGVDASPTDLPIDIEEEFGGKG
jgi:putative hemolysin